MSPHTEMRELHPQGLSPSHLAGVDLMGPSVNRSAPPNQTATAPPGGRPQHAGDGKDNDFTASSELCEAWAGQIFGRQPLSNLCGRPL